MNEEGDETPAEAPAEKPKRKRVYSAKTKRRMRAKKASDAGKKARRAFNMKVRQAARKERKRKEKWKHDGRPPLYSKPMRAMLYVDFTREQYDAIATFCERRWLGIRGFVRELAIEASGQQGIGILSARYRKQPKPYKRPAVKISYPVLFRHRNLNAVTKFAEANGESASQFARRIVLEKIGRPDLLR